MVPPDEREGHPATPTLGPPAPKSGLPDLGTRSTDLRQARDLLGREEPLQNRVPTLTSTVRPEVGTARVEKVEP